MKVLIASMSNLFLEAFQLAIHNRRPYWKVETHLIQTLSFRESLGLKIKEQCIDMVVIEITDYQHFSMAIENIKGSVVGDVNGVLLVDSTAGEVYHHLKDEERWIGILKTTRLDEFINLVEAFQSNVPMVTKVSLTEKDKEVLKSLASIQTIASIQHTHCLSIEEIEQSIYRINAYFKVSNYIEAFSKAVQQKIITI